MTGLLDRIGHVVADLIAARGENEALPASAAPDLARLAELLDRPPPPDFGGLGALAADFDGIPSADLPEDLTATLRDYQRVGVDWLSMLSRADTGLHPAPVRCVPSRGGTPQSPAPIQMSRCRLVKSKQGITGLPARARTPSGIKRRRKPLIDGAHRGDDR